MFRPQYRYTHALVENLLLVENARAAIDVLPLPNGASRELRARAHQAQVEAAKRLDRQLSSGFANALTQASAKSSESLDEKAVDGLAVALAGRGSLAYRASSKLLYNPSHTELIYVPPDAAEVSPLISALLDWLADSWDVLPAVVLAGMTHQELLLIQPFEEHNGPLARLAGHAVLSRKGYGFGGYSSAEVEFASDLAEYENASRSSHTGVHSSQADFTTWLEYFSGKVAVAAGHARDELLTRSKPPEAEESGVTPDLPVALRDRQLRALHYIRENGAIRSGEYQRLVEIVPDTARRDFDELMAKGLIEVRGVGRGTHYVLTRRGVDEAERRRPL